MFLKMLELHARERVLTFSGLPRLMGDFPKLFLALALYKEKIDSLSETVHDPGENVIHDTQLQDLKQPTRYVFYIIAQNKIGNSLSESAQCPT